MLTALLAITLGFAAPDQTLGFVHFKSPSGNINCIGSAAAPTYVDCLVKKATWRRPPSRPLACDLDWIPTDLAMSRRRVSVGSCRGDIGPLCVNQPNDRCSTLNYGRSVDIGPIRCTSDKNGVTCRYRTAPRVGFRIAREGYTIFRS